MSDTNEPPPHDLNGRHCCREPQETTAHVGKPDAIAGVALVADLKHEWQDVMTTKPTAKSTTGDLKPCNVPASGAPLAKAVLSPQYRNAALEHYRRQVDGSLVNLCVMCGFGIPAVLEVAHLDQNRNNNDLDNLAVLCPNCHKMLDLGLIPPQVVQLMRAHDAQPNWKIRMKDAGAKAGLARKRSGVAKRAAATRAKNKSADT